MLFTTDFSRGCPARRLVRPPGSAQAPGLLRAALTLGSVACLLGGCSDAGSSSQATGGTAPGGGFSSSGSGLGGGGTGGSAGGGTAGGGATGSAGVGGKGSSGSGNAPSGGVGGAAAAGPGTGGFANAGMAGGGTGGASGSGPSGGAAGVAGAAASGGTAGVAGGAAGAGSGAAGAAAGGTSSEPPIVDLFDGTDLDGWTAYRETQATSPGTKLTTTEAEAIFKPEDGAIRVYGDAPDQSTQARHTLVSDASYTRYRFWLDYRWGTKKFAPYTDLARYPRDAGVLWHLHADETQVWPSSIEFQIKDGTVGDIFALYARCTLTARNGGTTFVDAADGGTPKVVDGANGYVQHGRSESFEVADWNTIELDVDLGTAVYIVNGHVVNKVLSVNDWSGSAGAPVTSGPIALQAEHAEVFYRNVRIQVLP